MRFFVIGSILLAASSVVQGLMPADAPHVKWKFKTDGPVISSPCYLDGNLFFGSSDSFLYAVDTATGKQKWKFETNGAITGSPVIHGGALFFGSWDGFLYAVDVKTGKQQWKFQLGFERKFQAKHIHGHFPAEQTIPDAWDFFTSTPTIAEGKVVIGSGDGNVYAVSENEGKLAWKFKTGDVVHASPTIGNELVYIGSWDSRFYAINLHTGKQKWVFQAGLDPERHNQEGFQGSATLKGETIFVGCRDNHVYALDAMTGAKKWAFSQGTGWTSNRPLVTEDTVWVGSNPFRGLDIKTGALKVDTKKTGTFSSPISSGSTGYIGTLLGSLFAFDTNTGEMKWEFQTDARRADPMKLLDSTGKYNPEAVAPVFGDFQDDYILMYKRFSLGSIISTPVVVGGIIYVGSTDGYCYALE